MAIEIKENFFPVFYFIIKKKSILISSVCENCKIPKCLPMRNEGIDDWTIRQSLLNGGGEEEVKLQEEKGRFVRGGSIHVTDEVAKTRYSDFSIRLCKLM